MYSIVLFWETLTDWENDCQTVWAAQKVIYILCEFVQLRQIMLSTQFVYKITFT